MGASLDDSLKPAISQALRLHEIGTASPYQLSFAAKGRSGATFGFMQGDLAGNQPEVKQTFHDALAAAGMSEAVITGFTRQLSKPLTCCPLTAQDRARIDAALLASRSLVDAMDLSILDKVYADLGTCIAAAAAAHRTIAPDALIYMALWINMSGPPTELLVWLRGGSPRLRHPVSPPGTVVGGPAMESYLAATDFFVDYPENMQAMNQCVAAGAVSCKAAA